MKQACFFNLNIKHKNHVFFANMSAAEYWLDKMGQAPVFFGPETAEQVLAGHPLSSLLTRQRNELMRFLRIQEECARRNIRPFFVTIDSGFIWIYEPVGRVQSGERCAFVRDNSEACDTPKFYDIALAVPRISFASAPLILASMKTNQAFSRGTFVEIVPKAQRTTSKRGYDGNLAAIHSLLGSWPDELRIEPLDCLSSVELETLVAKIFEELGCFVPAYRGGVLPMVDLFLHVPAEGIQLTPRVYLERVVSLQIKLNVERPGDWRALADWTSRSPGNVLLTLQSRRDVGSGVDFRPGALLTREWVEDALRQCPRTTAWLNRTLEWLPIERHKDGSQR